MPNDTTNTGPGALTHESVAMYRESFDSDPAKKLVQNVVTQHDVNDIALSRSVVTESPHSFSIVLDDWGVTNQARSGRCWMFAGLNLCRVDTRNVLNVKEFEFSQNYLMFWDKLERANFFLEAIIDTATREVDDRTVHRGARHGERHARAKVDPGTVPLQLRLRAADEETPGDCHLVLGAFVCLAALQVATPQQVTVGGLALLVQAPRLAEPQARETARAAAP